MATEKNTSHCTGDCMKCNQFQRALCSSQVGYYNMKMLELLTQAVTALQEETQKLSEKVAALQESGDALFNPIAQEGKRRTE